MSERDTHFQGFARLLGADINDAYAKQIRRMESGVIYSGEDMTKVIEHMIAQRAYDLVCYASQFMPGVDSVPDIKEWSDLQE